ncbi:hypothetical protein GCM10010330_76460 [Streptomyces tendae]|nr:hypothetical protein GCM10010330_76460 [Streptomyces tendae]
MTRTALRAAGPCARRWQAYDRDFVHLAAEAYFHTDIEWIEPIADLEEIPHSTRPEHRRRRVLHPLRTRRHAPFHLGQVPSRDCCGRA